MYKYVRVVWERINLLVDEELNNLGRNSVICQQGVIKRSALTVAQ
jgi:hypothetical protein